MYTKIFDHIQEGWPPTFSHLEKSNVYQCMSCRFCWTLLLQQAAAPHTYTHTYCVSTFQSQAQPLTLRTLTLFTFPLKLLPTTRHWMHCRNIFRNKASQKKVNSIFWPSPWASCNNNEPDVGVKKIRTRDTKFTMSYHGKRNFCGLFLKMVWWHAWCITCKMLTQSRRGSRSNTTNIFRDM